LEANHVGTDYAIQDVLPEWELCEESFLWEGGVEIPADANADVDFSSSLSQQEWKEHKVIVVDPNEITILHFVCYGVRKSLICLAVCIRSVVVERCQIVLMMK
jgi:hypothetical protein